jgi:hypothetical protein
MTNITCNSSVAESNDDRSEAAHGNVSEACEKINEKRGSTREAGLAALLKNLRSGNKSSVDAALNYQETSKSLSLSRLADA